MRLRTALSLLAVAFGTFAGAAAIRGWRHAIFSGGIAVAALIVGGEMLGRLGSARTMRPSEFEAALARRTEDPSRPADLVSLERIFSWEAYTPEEFSHRVRPTLLHLASSRFRERYGFELGDERADPPGRIARYLIGRGPDATISTDEIAALVDEISSLR